MPKPALGPVKVGDDLIVISRRNSGIAETAVVVKKAGRVWLDLVPKDHQGYAWQWRMRRDTQTDGGQTGYAPRFVTPEQHAWEQRVDAVRKALFDTGITVNSASPWNKDEDRLLALAAFVAAYDADHPSDPAV